MPKRTSTSGSELFIVDNSDDDWKVLRYLHDWCPLSKSIDIASGYFEIGALLALKDEWQQVDAIRILMGDEVSKRTHAAFEQGLANIRNRLNNSLEDEKNKNDFLVGVPAIVEAIRSGKIQCRVYRKDKFHAKAYITHARQEVIGSFALVGSSNFTYPGLTENVELNVQISGTPVAVLQEWYEQHWDAAEDVTPEILRVIERHVREYSPFEVYAKALQEFFKGHEMTADEWELSQSRIFPILNQYQKEGYHALLKIARQHGGAFLCDGVGLGKTFVGLMLIERFVAHDDKRVALFVPKSSREPVWEAALDKYLENLGGAFSALEIYSHTDLQRGGKFIREFKNAENRADVVIIDEAHHFRNPGHTGEAEQTVRSRYRRLYDLIEGPKGVKQVFLLTATPINNRLIDLQHMIELFSRKKQEHFKSTLGINSLQGHFRRMEKDLEKSLEARGQGNGKVQTTLIEAEEVLTQDTLFKNIVVQRSRAYVRESQIKQGATAASFPTREDPQVAVYSVKQTYGKLLDLVERAFQKDKPLFALSIYYPLAYYQGEDKTIDPWVEGRQKQVVGLIRTQFLKRFESSAKAFEQSCERLLQKLYAFAEKHSETPGEQRRLEAWKIRNKDLIHYVHEHQLELWGSDEDDDREEDLITEEMLDAVEYLPRDEYDVAEILSDTLQDMDQVAEFIKELKKFEPKHDDKLKALLKLLKKDPVMSKHKVLIFSEFADTARYLKKQLQEAGIEGVEEIDSGTKKNLGDVIRRFAPYYNGTSSGELSDDKKEEIRVLISTDILSEGLNLQDATRLINYDLHWNPVRLMQRIGRVDRRMNPDIEAQLIADHPDQKPLRGKIAFWNFIPPEELNALLTLYSRVSHKTLRISKTFGIEGRKLLTPDDDYEALRDFIHEYEGEKTAVEKMHLEFQDLTRADPSLLDRLGALPGRVFSGKRHVQSGTQAVFFCYVLPAADRAAPTAAVGNALSGVPRAISGVLSSDNNGLPWTEEAGLTAWYLYDLAAEKIVEDAPAIFDVVRCRPDTPRECSLPRPKLAEIRKAVELHIKHGYLKSVQAPGTVKPILKCWMELN
jgi:superfamily II DNA or RNA helicase